MRIGIATQRLSAGSLLGLVLWLVGTPSPTQAQQHLCGSIPILSSVTYSATSTAELSPSTPFIAIAQTTRKTVYGRDGALVGFAISTHGLKGVKSLVLTIPGDGLGSGTFRVDAPRRQLRLTCSLSLPDLATFHYPPPVAAIRPLLKLAAGGVYRVTAVGTDGAGVTSTVEVTYKVLQLLQTAGSAYQLHWSSQNAARRELFEAVTNSDAVRVGGDLPADGTLTAAPGTYFLVAMSPNFVGDPAPPSPDSCKSDLDTADAICRQFEVLPGPQPSGLVQVNFNFYFDTSPAPCSNAMTGTVAIQGSSPPGAASPSFVGVLTGNYHCIRGPFGEFGAPLIVYLPQGQYDFRAQSSVGGDAICDDKDVPSNGAGVTFNGNAKEDDVHIPMHSCLPDPMP